MDEEGVQVIEMAHGLRFWEKLGLTLLLVIMVVSTFSTALASQQAQKAAQNTDILASCFTPHTSCANLLAESSIKTTAENKCVIDALINLPPSPERQEKREKILANYDTCVTTEIKAIKALLPPVKE